MKKIKEANQVSILARKSYKGNMKRNNLTIIAIWLTTFMLTTIFSIGISYWDAITQRSIAMEGMKYDISLPEPTEEQVEKAKDMKEILLAGLSVKCAIIQKYESTPVNIRLFWSDEINWEKQCVPAFEFVKGTYPENENEVMLSSKALKKLGIENPKVGMKIPVVYQDLEGGRGGDDGHEVEFILSGYYRDYSGKTQGFVSKKFYDNTGAKQTDLTQGSLNITLKNHLYSAKDINSMEEELGVEGNQILFADTLSVITFYKVVASLVGLSLLIVISGYLFIFNTLYISISKDIRFYGQLKTIGMETRQIKGMIYRQIFWVSRIGITIGLLTGGVVSFYLMPWILKITNPTLAVKNMIQIHPTILIGSALFSLFTVWISSRKPIRIASEISPIEATKYIGSSSYRTKNKKSVNGGMLTHIAWRNVFREKKQALIIFTSFFIALTVFLSINGIVNGNSAKNILNALYKYDIRILNNTIGEDIPSEKIITSQTNKIRELQGVSSLLKVKSSKIVIPYNEEYLGKHFERLYETPVAPGDHDKDIELYKENPESELFLGKIVGIDETGFDKFNDILGGTVDKEAFMSGEIGIISPSLGISAEEVVEKELSFYFPSDEFKTVYSIKIATESLEYRPNYFAAGISPDIIISEELFEKMVNAPVVELVDVNFSEPYNKDLDQAIRAIFSSEKEVTFDSKMDDYDEMRQSENQLKTLGRSLGIILAVLAILNYFNMITTGIQNRTKEFAILQSIGMTSKQLRLILIYEGVLYGVISILLTTIIGTPISYLVYQAQNKYNVQFSIPVLDNMVVFGCILFVCILVPIVTFKLSQKSTIIEQLRDLE